MTSILDRLNSEDDTGRIEQLEKELKCVRIAFEEYISTTEGLEVDVKEELRKMQTQLNHSTSANAKLNVRLRKLDALLQKSETFSKDIQEKLKTETQLRRKAEKALTETELELKSKVVKIRQLERSDSSTLRIVDSGVITEMVNNTSKGFSDRELEAVTEELTTTQEKLQKTEEQLQKSEKLVQDLEKNFQNIGNKVHYSLSRDDKELLQELDEIRAEINAARSDIQSESTDSESRRERPSEYESRLEEFRDENAKLLEEVTCLRSILYDHDVTGIAMDKNATSGNILSTLRKKIIDEVKEEHQCEVKSLRQHIDEILNENMHLQEKFKKLEIASSSKKCSRDNFIQLKEDEDEIIGVKFTNDLVYCVEDLATDEKLSKTERLLKQSKEECTLMMSEILSLTESLYNANRSRRGAVESNEQVINLTGLGIQNDELLRAQNEVEDKNREIIKLENNLVCTQEEVRLLSEEISYMSSAFEKAQDEYNSVVEELQQTESALAAAKDTRFNQETELKRLELVAEKTPQKNAEIYLLRTQFEKLNEKSANLAHKVREAESEVLSVREKHEKAIADNGNKLKMFQQIHDEIKRAVSETDHRNREVEDLELMMENRMSNTEKNIEMIESDIAVAMRTLRTTQVASLEGTSMPSLFRTDSVIEDSQLIETASKTDDTTTKKTKATEVDILTSESSLEQSSESLETSEIIKKLTNLGVHLSEDDRTAITTASLSTKSIYSDKNDYSKKNRKVANPESLSFVSMETRELETRGEVGIEQRE